MGRWSLPVAGLTVLAMLAAGGLTDPASAAVATIASVSQSAPAPVDVVSKPDQVSALLAAHQLGHEVAISDLTTAMSMTWAQPNGSLKTEMDQAPVRVQRAGAWVDVDTTLAAVGGRVSPAAVVEAYTFSGGGSGPLVAWSNTAGQALDLSWPTALPVPTVSGDTATYAGVLPGTDLLLSARRAGWELSLRVNARPTKPVSVSLPLSLKGLRSSQRADGSFGLLNGAGKSVVNSPLGQMWDATGDPTTGRGLHTAPVASSLGSGFLTLSPAQSFLADPSTVFPVIVDPLMTIADTSDAYVNKKTPTTAYYQPGTLKDGFDGTNTFRSLLFFHDWAGMRGKHVLDAYLQMWNSYTSTCAANSSNEQVDVYTLGGPWTYLTTWNTQPSLAIKQGSAIFAHGGQTGCAAAYQNITITGAVAKWADYSDSTGMLGVVSTSETSVLGYKNFYSAETGLGGVPKIYVTYNSYPSVPTSLSPVNNATWDGLTPALSAVVADPDGGYVQGKFFLQDVTAGNSWVGPSAGTFGKTVTSGQRSGTTTPTLTSGHTYRYQVESSDTVPDVSAPSAWTSFLVDTTPPGAPTVSSTQYPAGSWNTGGGPGTFTFAATAGGSGIDHYLYGLDTPTPGSATPSGTATATLATVPDGWHTLYVVAVDMVGNLSTVTPYSFGASPAVTSPAEGAVSQQSVSLTAVTAPDPATTQVTFYYRRASTDPWAVVPSADTTAASGSPAYTGWPYAFTALTTNGQGTPALTWNLAGTLNNQNGTVQVAVCFGPSATCSAIPGAILPAAVSSLQPANASLDINAFNVAATTSVGPGAVNLLTGNLQVAATDASVPGNSTNLSVGRTFNTFTAASTTGMFGPGWTASLPVDTAASDWTSLADTGPALTATDAGQSTTGFARTATGSYAPTGVDADSGMLITADSTTSDCRASTFYRCYALTDLQGDTTLFRSTTGGTSGTMPPAAGTLAAPVGYQVWTATQPGNNLSTAYSYTSGLVSQILAPVPTGATCTDPASAATWTPGCRALQLHTTTGKVTSITYATSDGTNPLLVDVACYDYDGNGRLWHVWDPRDITTPGTGTHPILCNPAAMVRPLTYGYDGSGRILTITPTALAFTTFGYAGAKLDTSTVSDGTTSYTTTMRYGVPVAPEPGHLEYRPDLTNTATSTWAQADTPDANTGGTAICPPGASTPTTSSGDLRDCPISYPDVNGRAVNTTGYSGTGAAGWHLTTTEYDTAGHMVRALTAANQEEALDPTSAARLALGLPASTATASLQLSTISQYTNSSLDGQPDLTDTFGPYHQVELPGGTLANARAHTHLTYDDGTEAGHPKGGANQPIAEHLLRTSQEGASRSADATATSETDQRSTETRYWLGTNYTGWTFHAPMQTITDPAGLAITNTTLYDPGTGEPVESRMPSNSGGGTAGSTLTAYYTADASSTDASCRNKPLWAGAVCKTSPAAQPGVSGLPGLVTTTNTLYDYLQRPTTVTETVPDASSTTHTRTTTSTFGFNSAANPYAGTDYSTAEAVSGGTGNGAAQPTLTKSFSTATGLATGTAAAATTENPATATATGYDTFGRVTSFTDDTSATGAQANTTTTSYDSAGRVLTTGDAHSTATTSYNNSTEHRGLATTLAYTVNSTPTAYTGSYTGTHNSDGALSTQTDPNNVTQTLTRDENGQPTALVDTQGANDWLKDSIAPSIHGQAVHHAGPAGVQDYSYDTASRLTQATDTTLGGNCAIRQYAFDTDSNRLSSTAYPANVADGSCQTTPFTGGVTTTHSYDTADRLQPAGNDTGTTYDPWGRITTVPTTAVAGGNAVTVGYYSNDLVRSQAQGTTYQCWTRDADGQLKRSLTFAASNCTGTATTDRTNHYDNPGSDSPKWISEDTTSSTWTSNVTDLNDNLALTLTQAGVATYQYSNLHGDITATSAPADTTPTIRPNTDEYGNPPTGTPSQRYGWLGALQRSNNDLGGLTLMGVRLYNPQTGRFLSVDPVPGGNANAYTYPTDPINAMDPTGAYSWSAWWRTARYSWGIWSITRHFVVMAGVLTVWLSHQETDNFSWWTGGGGLVLALIGFLTEGATDGAAFSLGILSFAAATAVRYHKRLKFQIGFSIGHQWDTVWGHTVNSHRFGWIYVFRTWYY
jgi:RHS repeat-associated protein